MKSFYYAAVPVYRTHLETGVFAALGKGGHAQNAERTENVGGGMFFLPFILLLWAVVSLGKSQGDITIGKKFYLLLL